MFIKKKLSFVFIFISIFLVNQIDAWLWSSAKVEEPKEQETTTLPTLLNNQNQKLSDQAHFVDSDGDQKFEHNIEFDHEAFLGKEESEKFKRLTPEESKLKLGEIVEKIDVNKDGGVTLDELKDWINGIEKIRVNAGVEERWKMFSKEDTLEIYLDKNYGLLDQLAKIDKNRDGLVNEFELRNWIRNQHRKSLQKATDAKWMDVDFDKDGKVVFNEVLESGIGLQDTWTDEEKETNKEQYKTYQKMFKRDEIRFKAADQDKDGKLSKKEYAYFLHPEESPVMRDVVISETLEDMDKNSDGVVSVDEFLNELWDGVGPEPEWLKQEKEHFKHVRDTNKDSVLDREELANWILPVDFDRSLREAQHLLYETDVNKDGKLSKQEILDKSELFVASTATNHGADLHQEL